MREIGKYIEVAKELHNIADKNHYKEYKFRRDLELLEAQQKILDYWDTKADDKGNILFGKFFEFNMVWDERGMYCAMWLRDNDAENSMYDMSFFSHSGIQEFVMDVFVPLISSMAGETDYSHCFDSADLTSALKCINNSNKKMEESYGDLEDIVNKCKKVIDWIYLFATNEQIAASTDRLFMEYMIELKRINKYKEEA